MKPWDRDRAVGARWCEGWTTAITAEPAQDLLMSFRRDVSEIGFGYLLPAEGLRFDRERLRGRSLLAGKIRSGHRAILHREKRLPSEPVKEKYETCLGHLRHGFAVPAIVFHRHEVGIDGQVMIPKVVAQRLKM